MKTKEEINELKDECERLGRISVDAKGNASPATLGLFEMMASGITVPDGASDEEAPSE